MGRSLLVGCCALTLLLDAALLSHAQPRATSSPDKEKANLEIVVLHPEDSEPFEWDGGRVRFLVSSEHTDSQWAVIEVTERPGYKTPVHRHNYTDEQFYVVEGVLTVMINGKTSKYPAGSYVLIPRGTPHAHGNLGERPSKHILTVMPGGFERFFRDRVELVKTLRPDHADFKRRLAERRQNVDSEVLREWDVSR